MVDALLPYYHRELATLRDLAAEFAAAHPRAAGRLRLSAETVDDPHVARLLEGVALLSARAHQRLDDEFPELADALLEQLYPNALASIPSSAIVQMRPDPAARSMVRVPRNTMLETPPVQGEPCRFRTMFDVDLWPLAVDSVRLGGAPLAAPAYPGLRGAQSVLRIALRTHAPDLPFTELELDSLCFHLRGSSEQTTRLHELLLSRTLAVALAANPNDPTPTFLPATAVTAVGFAEDEALTPWPLPAFPGFRLLGEYFAMPEKFLFVRLDGLRARTLLHASDRMEIFIYLRESRPDLETRLKPDVLALGCTPAVNLFPRRCEPIPLTGESTDYPVVPDYRHRAALEVWRIERVRESREDGSWRPWRPFYQRPVFDTGSEAPRFYHLIRRDSPLGGSEALIGPVDVEANGSGGGVLSVEALCSNRNLPAALPFGGGEPRLFLPDGPAGVAEACCLTAPTPNLQPRLRDGRAWRLLSLLSLGHASLAGGPDNAAEALRQMLRLHDLRDTPETRAAIAALTEVSSAPGVARVPGARPGSFCRGLDITLHFAAAPWEAGGLYLLANVAERFLALHTSVNSFVRCAVALQGRPGTLIQFPPRAGVRVLA